MSDNSDSNPETVKAPQQPASFNGAAEAFAPDEISSHPGRAAEYPQGIIEDFDDGSAAEGMALEARLVDGEVYSPTDNLDRVLLPVGISRPLAVSYLNQRVKTNEFGLPVGFVRSDLLPADLDNLLHADVDAATIGLFYYEGYPTLENGVAFWAQLPHETRASHDLFMDFVGQAETIGIRQLDMLAQTTSKDLAELNILYQEYFWSIRARAYDMFIVAAEQKKRHARIRKTEDKHFTKAGELFDQVLSRFAEDDWIEELSAKEAIEVMEALIKVQRLSLGLTGQRASSTPMDALPAGASTEALMRNIARNAGVSAQGSDDFAARLAQLTADPASGMVIQEAILKLGRAQPTGSSGAGMGDGFD